MYTIYLARPISGCSADEVFGYYDKLIRKLEFSGAHVLSPMTGKAHLRYEKKYAPQGYDNPVATDHAIVERDRWMVAQSHIVYVNLVGAKDVSIGCVAEMAWAHDRGVHTVLALEEGNVHEHAFVMQMADIRYETHEDALRYLVNMAAGKQW